MNARKARRAWATALAKHCKPGTLVHIEFQHDPWCGVYLPERYCTCSPTRVLLDDKGGTLAKVDGGGPYDPLEFLGGSAT